MDSGNKTEFISFRCYGEQAETLRRVARRIGQGGNMSAALRYLVSNADVVLPQRGQFAEVETQHE